MGMYVYVTRKGVEVLLRAIESRISELEGLNFTLGNMYDDELRRLDNLKKVLEGLNFTLGNMYDDELRRLDDLKGVLERHL